MVVVAVAVVVVCGGGGGGVIRIVSSYKLKNLIIVSTVIKRSTYHL